MSDTHYKIRHKKTGRWSMGGYYVSADGTGSLWVETGGKIWTKIGPVRNHISTHISQRGSDLSDWEVVEFKMVEVSRKGIHEVVTPKKLMEMLTQ